MSVHRTGADEYGDCISVTRETVEEVVEGTTSVVPVKHTMIASSAARDEWTVVRPEDLVDLARKVLVDTGHVVVSADDAREAAALADTVDAALHPLRDRLRAALGEPSRVTP